ncbi:MAG: hypothetical protein GYA57_06125 [Myxococcales bacterium]|nr:hypothetical protein [Myxococcales bacterium]
MTGRFRCPLAAPLSLLFLLALPPARPARAAEAPAALEPNREWFALGLSLGAGYATVDSAGAEGADLLVTQLGVRSIFLSQWELALDLRAGFDPARPGVDAVHSYEALLWLVADLDLLPLVLFVGVGGGGVFEGAVPFALHGTVGACVGLALWIEATWRLVLRGTQRWVFRADGSVSGGDPTGSSSPFLPTEVLLAGEYFF